MCAQKFVKSGDKTLEFGNEFDKAFGNKNCTEIVAFGGAGRNDAGDVVHDIVEAHVLFLDFLGDDAHVGLCLKRAFQSDMAGRATHQFDEVPVFLGRVAVALYVADDFRVNLGGGVETERSFDKVIL